MRNVILPRRATLRWLFAVTLVLAGLDLLITPVWHAVFPSVAPHVLYILIASPLAVALVAPPFWWLYRAARTGVFHARDFPASWPVQSLYGVAISTALVLHNAGPSMANRAAAAELLAGLALVALVRIVDGTRVLVVLAAGGAGVAVFTAFAASRAVFALALHDAHLHGWLAVLQAEHLPAWDVLLGFAVAAIVLAVLRRAFPARLAARPAKARGFASGHDAPADGSGPAGSGHGAGAHVNRAQAAREELERERAELDERLRAADAAVARAQRGAAAEQAMLAALRATLVPRGWLLVENLFIPEERIGDIDALLTAPSGRQYAIDAKLREGARIVFDPARAELTVYHKNGHVTEETFLDVARRQVDALGRHGYARAQPVLCFIGSAAVDCEPIIAGVYIVAAERLLSWLEALEAHSDAAKPGH